MLLSLFRFPIRILARQSGDRPLVLVDLPGDDLILCQITTQMDPDAFSIPLEAGDLVSGKLSQSCFIRTQCLFTADQRVILYTAASMKNSKLLEVLAKVQTLFSAERR